jgi:hypothetical protein
MMHRTTKGKPMTPRSTLSAIGNFFDTLGSAVAVSRAVEARRAPRASDLKRLGIDPAAFGTIGRR